MNGLATARAHEARIRQIAEEHGTPLYIYDGEQFERQVERLKGCFPPDFELFYAVKANPLLGVLQLFERAGCGAEVASEGELLLALRAGYAPQKVVYTCPGKTDAGISLAVRRGVYSIIVESSHEAERVNAIATRSGRRVPIGARINPGFANQHATLQMSGLPSQFGIDEDSLDEFFETLRAQCAAVDLVGIHVYSGTQILSAEDLVLDAARIVDLAVGLANSYAFDLKFIDIGGGFGVPYLDRDPPLDLAVLEEGYRDIWNRYRQHHGRLRVIVESGRFLTAEGGDLITRVLSTKLSRGRKYVICDAGYSHHPSSLHIGRYQQNRFPISALDSSGPKERVTVVGPTGTPVDILANDIDLDIVKPGDLLRVGKSGAYGYTNSCQLFFSGPTPAELMGYRDNVYVLRKRGDAQRMLRDHEWVDWS